MRFREQNIRAPEEDACTAGYSHKYDIPLPTTLSPSMLAGPENMEGRSPCRENKDSLPIQIPWWDTFLVQFKEEKLIQIGLFITKILAADGLRSHVTITVRDKSRYDLILKINETA